MPFAPCFPISPFLVPRIVLLWGPAFACALSLPPSNTRQKEGKQEGRQKAGTLPQRSNLNLCSHNPATFTAPPNSSTCYDQAAAPAASESSTLGRSADSQQDKGFRSLPLLPLV